MTEWVPSTERVPIVLLYAAAHLNGILVLVQVGKAPAKQAARGCRKERGACLRAQAVGERDNLGWLPAEQYDAKAAQPLGRERACDRPSQRLHLYKRVHLLQRSHAGLGHAARKGRGGARARRGNGQEERPSWPDTPHRHAHGVRLRPLCCWDEKVAGGA